MVTFAGPKRLLHLKTTLRWPRLGCDSIATVCVRSGGPRLLKVLFLEHIGRQRRACETCPAGLPKAGPFMSSNPGSRARSRNMAARSSERGAGSHESNGFLTLARRQTANQAVEMQQVRLKSNVLRRTALTAVPLPPTSHISAGFGKCYLSTSVWPGNPAERQQQHIQTQADLAFKLTQALRKKNKPKMQATLIRDVFHKTSSSTK